VTTLYVAEASGVPALSWIDVAGAFAIGVALRWPPRHFLRGRRAG
jgi:hypothetical protein